MTVNPFKRLRELAGTSQKEFLLKYDLSKTMMTFIESGQAVELSDRMIVALGQECYEKGIDAKKVLAAEFGARDLQTAYQEWKATERVTNAYVFQKPLTGTETFERSPFQVFIEDTTGSQQKFCKLLKVPAAAVMRYAKGDILTMPKAIEEALIQVNFRQLKDLKELQAKWIGFSS